MATTPQLATNEVVLAPGIRSDWLTQVLSTKVGRLTLPSLSDLFFAALIIWLFVAGGDGWKGLLLDGDCGWHIRTGEYILNTHTVPQVDLYSFTKVGQPWYAWEWLSDVCFAMLFRLAGLKGVVLAAGAVIAAFATVVLRRLFAQGANLFIALAVGLLAVGAASIHFLARPHIFTLLFLAVGMWIIEEDRRAEHWRLWLLVPLTVVWTNMHGGFLALIACLGCLVVGTSAEVLIGSGARWRSVARYAAVTAACALASLVNPYGVQLHLHIASYLRSDWIRNVIQEFQSPSFRSENLMQFEVLMFAGLVIAGIGLRSKRVTEALWICGFAHLALGSVRHVPVFVTVSAPIIAAELTGWWSLWASAFPRKSLMRIVEQMGRDLSPAFRRNTLWPALVVAAFACTGDRMNWPVDFPDINFPTHMVASHGELLDNHRVFSYDQWGDYLIFKNPKRQVFIDGRSDFYGPEIGDEYLSTFQGQWTWRDVLEKYEIDVVLAPVNWPLASILKTDQGWHLVADDKQALIFTRTAAKGTSEARVRHDQGPKDHDFEFGRP